MVGCSVFGCNSNTSGANKISAETVSLYRLPDNQNERKIWKARLGRSDKLPPDENIRVCSLHFKEEDFHRDN